MRKKLSHETGWIYEIRNIKTRHCYVGSTVQLRRRWQYHKRRLRKGKHENQYLQRAWTKHTESAFVFNVLETFCLDNSDVRGIKFLIQEREQYWIDYLRSSERAFGYNLCSRAYSRAGCTNSEESKKKTSLTLRGRVFTAEHRQKLSEAGKRRKLTEPEVARLRAMAKTAGLGKKRTAEQRERYRRSKLGDKNPQFGKPVTEEVRDKIRASSLGEKNHFYGKHHTEKTKKLISDAWRRKHHTKETKKMVEDNVEELYGRMETKG